MASLNDTTMTIRVNGAIKKQAQELFSDLGLDMSTAVNMFLRRSVREERIPFEVSRNVEPNFKTQAAMKRVENGKGLVGPFRTVAEAMDYLNA